MDFANAVKNVLAGPIPFLIDFQWEEKYSLTDFSYKYWTVRFCAIT